MQRAMRMRKAAGAIVGAAMLLAACGDDAPAALSGDDLASELESVCRTATRAIGKLDPEDGADYYSEVVDLLDTASEELGALPVGDKDAGDVEDFVSLVEDEVKAMKDVADAADSGDAAALTAAQGELAATSADADELASDLDADKCVGLGVAALAEVSTPPATTLPVETTLPAESTLPATTVPPTTAAPVTLPTTVPPTVPVTPAPTTPVVTSPPGGSIITKNMIDNWNTPAGYTFEQESGDIFTAIFFAPESVPSLAPSIVNYEVGALASDGGAFYVMVALELSADFTDDQISDWIDYEGTGPGDVQSTPGGLSVWVEPPSGEIEYTEYLWIIGKYGMLVRVDDGVDGLAFVDAFTTANFE